MGSIFKALIPALVFQLGWWGSYAVNTMTREYIPAQKKVQAGYVVPSKLEILCEDLDHNGEPEVIMKYNGKTYLLKESKDGNPQALRYSIVPQQIQIYGGD